MLSAMFIALLALLGNLHISIPLLTPFYNFMSANALIGIISILFFEIVVPLGLALLLGARRREMGFQKGYHTWRVTALSSAFPALLLVIAIVQGKLTLLAVLGRIVLVLLIAALPEEIVMRGVLMTRLMRLLGTGWGIALSALFFGLLHFGTDIGKAGSTSVLLVLAISIYGQMSGGICFAIVLQRTQSLIPGIISHALSDAAVGLLPF